MLRAHGRAGDRNSRIVSPSLLDGLSYLSSQCSLLQLLSSLLLADHSLLQLLAKHDRDVHVATLQQQQWRRRGGRRGNIRGAKVAASWWWSRGVLHRLPHLLHEELLVNHGRKCRGRAELRFWAVDR